MFKASVNKKVFEISGEEDSLLVDGTSFQWDLKEISKGYFHILMKNKSYTAEIVKSDITTKTFTLKINSRLYTVSVKDKFDLLLEKMGISNGASGKVNNIKAPMPGLIIDLKISVGDAVKTGESLLILEAMKMENIIKSPGDGIVKSVKIKKGDSVEKGQVLIEF
jgi:biotin carboxyl carrier protein